MPEREEEIKGPDHGVSILHNSLGVPNDRWPAERDRAVALLREPGYQTVLAGRPLLYAFAGKAFPFGRFRELLSAARDAGLNPYSVFMGWDPTRDFKEVKDEGFDAVSAYAMGGDQPSFAGLVESVRQRYWRNAASSGVPYVPLVTTGWDKRPRKDNPVSWEKDHGYHRQEVFPSRATPSEIADHVGDALSFVRSHPRVCPANTVIVYAWNEYDEGGWLAPTRLPDGTPDTSRLDAVRSVLQRQSVVAPPERRSEHHNPNKRKTKMKSVAILALLLALQAGSASAAVDLPQDRTAYFVGEKVLLTVTGGQAAVVELAAGARRSTKGRRARLCSIRRCSRRAGMRLR